MSNPELGQFELEGLQQIPDDKFEEYLQSACILYRQNQGPMSPELLRSLLIVLKYAAGDEEADLKERESQGRRHEGPHRLRAPKIGALGDHQLMGNRKLSVLESIWSAGGKSLRAPP